jgi:predicted AAA+ superfamily ATPase
MAVGGMPAAVREYAQAHSIQQAQQELSSVVLTYRDDFSKYRKQIHAGRLQTILDRLPHLVGRKLKYVDISRDERAKDLAQGLRMLEMARIVYCVHHSSANAQPLRAEQKQTDFKPLFLDVGLMMRALGLQITDLLNGQLLLANRGAVAEQFVGQQLLWQDVGDQEPELYYWNREKRGAAAEVDYLLPMGRDIVPVEVKAGTTGSLKSLQVFATEKASPLGLRFNQDLPSVTQAESNAISGKSHRFKLVSLPMYLISEARRLI